MAKCRFLATSADPRPDHVGVVYGQGHETDFDSDDYEFVMSLRATGKVEITDATGLPTAQSEDIRQEPFEPPKP